MRPPIAEGSFYQLLSFVSSSYPIGAFNYSHGLEYAVEAGFVIDKFTLQEWIAGIVTFGAGYNDCLFFKSSYDIVKEQKGHEEALRNLCKWASAFKQTAELWLESSQQSEAACKLLLDTYPSQALEFLYNYLKNHSPLPLAIIMGAAYAQGCLPLLMGLVGFLHSFVSNLIAAGIKLIPLGQTAGQQVLKALAPSVSQTAKHSLSLTLADLGSAALMGDWVSVSHEYQYTRLFRS